MASAYDVADFDFDLNYLNQPSKTLVGLESSNKLDKQRRAIIRAKKTTIATDLLIRRYYEKKEILELTEKNLLQSQEECKKVCIDYKCLMDRYEDLEQENKRLQNANEEQKENFNVLQNQFGALHSHANQLQELVKDRDIQIESMKIDGQLETSHSLNTQKQKLGSLQRENEMLMRHINLFIEAALGKKKLESIPRFTLKRYEKLNSSLSRFLADSGNEVFHDSNSNSISATDLINSPIDSLDDKEISSQLRTHLSGKTDTSLHKIDTDNYLDEAFSVDTGRGSSLAFSDSEKCFQSPDYSMNDDSPLSVYKNKPGLTSVATSPINVPEKVDTAVSPISFENDVMPISCQDNKTASLRSIFSPAKNEAVQSCVAASLTTVSAISTSTESPILFDSNDTQGHHSNVVITNFRRENSIQPSVESLYSVDDTVSSLDSFQNALDDIDEDQESSHVEIETNADSQVQQCLGQNNSSNICHDSTSDNEVEQILKSMRWKRKMITPIPTSPVKIRHLDEDIIVKKKIEVTKSENLEQFDCNESVKIREDNKVIHASLAYLAKEIMNIKSLLKNKLADDKVTECLNEIDYNITCQMRPIVITSQNDQNCENYLSKLPNPPTPVPTEVIGYSEDIYANTMNHESCTSLEEPIRKTLSLDGNITKSIQHNVGIVEKPITLNERLIFEDGSQNEERDSDDFDDEGPDLITIVEDTTVNEEMEKSKKRKEKIKRLSKLEKMRKRLAPKRKITSGHLTICQIKKNILANEKIMATVSQQKKTIKDSDSAATLNDKAVYEKALKVMAEIKSNQNENKKSIRKKTKPALVINKTENINEIISRDIEPCLPDSSSTNTTCGVTPNIINKCAESQICPIDNSSDNRLYSRIRRRRGLKRGSELKCQEDQPKRVLRSSVRQSISENSPQRNINILSGDVENPPENNRKLITYDELFGNDSMEPVSDYNNVSKNNTDVDDKTPNDRTQNVDECANTRNFELADSKPSEITDSRPPLKKMYETEQSNEIPMNSKHIHPKDSVLCRMIDQHASRHGKRTRKTTEALSTMICNKITDGIAKVIELPEDKSRLAMDKLIADLRSWKLKNFLSGLMKYMKNPERKTELFNLINSPPAPPMTKSEKILLSIIMQLNKSNDWGSDVINSVLESIEFTLFQLNHTPEFDVIESMAHFYALVCRRIRAKSRLRLFVMDAMYCIQYKAVPLIKQCMQVWMHILPLSNMRLAKNPLVTCLVYLLHFYKCDDKFKRVAEIRRILQCKYYFNISELNDNKIMEMLRNAIRELRDIPVERKMLRLALIIVAKRLGARWCQENMIKKLLLPLIERDAKTEKEREFCVSVLGPLLKPYPADMKVHCEIVVNELLDMLDQNPSPTMQEAIFTSLIYINKHNPSRILKALTMWGAQNVSSELEDLLKDFVKSKPIKGWKAVLSKLPLD